MGGGCLVHRQLWADPETRKQFERAVTRSGRVDAFEARLRCKEGCEIGALVSAEIVTIGGESCVLCAFQDISSRKRNEAELMQAIEAVMSDASWFSRAVVEKLAALRAPARFGSPTEPAPSGGDLTPRERDVLARMCRGQDDPTIRRRTRRVPQHRAQPCGRAVSQAGREPPQRRHHLGAGPGLWRGGGAQGLATPPRLVPMHYHDQSFGTIDHDLSGLIQDATAGA